MHSMERSPIITATTAIHILLLSHCVFFASSILHPRDFLALQSIRKSLADLPGSSFFSSAWDFTTDPCNFSGVSCVSDRVVSLNLGDPRAGSPGLSGHIHPAIGKLSQLAELSIVPGRIVGPLPDTLSELNNLRFLAISKNFISGSIPANIGQLKRLQTLDLSFNQIEGPIPKSIGDIPSLTNLILCHNRLSGSVPLFSASNTLIRVDFKHNDLSGSLLPSSFPPSVQYLSLSSNRLTGPVDRLLSRLNRLSYLDLSMNQFTGWIPSSVFSLPISSLQLQRNSFSGPVRPLKPVTASTVDISFNGLTGPISPLFSTVQNLYLNNNRFSGQVPLTLVDQLLTAAIRTLYLQHNYLTGIGIDPTAEIPQSSSLCLQYNCMVPPVQTPCPKNAGKQKSRPLEQCGERRG